MHIEFGANQKSHCRRKPGVGLQHLRRLLFNHKGTAKKFLDVGCEYQTRLTLKNAVPVGLNPLG